MGVSGGSQMGLLSGTDSLVLSSWWKPHRLGRRNAGHYQDGCNFFQHIYLTSNEPHSREKEEVFEGVLNLEGLETKASTKSAKELLVERFVERRRSQELDMIRGIMREKH